MTVYPFILRLGPLELTGYGLMMMVAFLMAGWAIQLDLRRRDHGHATGWMLGCYLLLGGLERFLIEFLRAKDDRLLGAFTVAQATSVALVAVGAVLLRLWWKPDAVSAQPAVLAALPKRAPPPPG